MKRLTYFIVLGVISSLVLLLTASAFSAQTQRTALVIGNAQYKQVALRNPVNDATDMAASLKKLGFTVTLVTDANLKKMERSVRNFGKQLRKGGVGLFYYAGHGLQVGGRNYLIPIDAMIESESDVKYESVDVGRVLGKMEDAHNDINIIILDACRDNPFGRGFRSYTRGLARIDAPSGSILAYATAPGDVAADGSGRNGLYTSKLLQHMTAQGTPIEQVFKNVRKDVVLASDGSQIPWESSSLIRDFYFVPPIKSVKKPDKKIYTTPKTIFVTPKKQVVASIAPPDRQPEINLRKEAIKNLNYISIKQTIYKYNFFESAINRSGSFKNKFVDNQDGTITDQATSLMWEKNGSSRSMSYASAKRYIKKINNNAFAGFSDWRIPTTEELASLIQRDKRRGMYLHDSFDAGQKYCWSIDELQTNSRGLLGSWIVDFKTGSIEISYYKADWGAGHWYSAARRESNYVKAVRAIK